MVTGCGREGQAAQAPNDHRRLGLRRAGGHVVSNVGGQWRTSGRAALRGRRAGIVAHPGVSRPGAPGAASTADGCESA